MAYNKQRETDRQKDICDYLSYSGLFFWRQNTAPAFQSDKYGARFRAMPKYSLNGVPDIIVIRNGKFIGLEVKTEIGKQSKFQKEFEEKCFAAGGEYYLVRNIDDVIKALKL